MSHFFRFWLWLTTGMVTREWVAVHRKHHARSDTTGDPHSPQIHGIRKVLREGAELYRLEAARPATVERYGRGTPDDWIERHLYMAHSGLGVTLMLAIDLALFGPIGLTMWAVQMAWIPLFAAGVINGIGHYAGYRHFAADDASRNILPWGLLVGGEELHNNHHAYPASARFSSRWWEFDVGWAYIQLLVALRLANVRKLAPAIRHQPTKACCDLDTLRCVITHRYAVLARLDKCLSPAASPHGSDPARWVQQARVMRQELAAVWSRPNASKEQLVKELEDWCLRAEHSGIDALQAFSRQLRCYA